MILSVFPCSLRAPILSRWEICGRVFHLWGLLFVGSWGFRAGLSFRIHQGKFSFPGWQQFYPNGKLSLKRMKTCQSASLKALSCSLSTPLAAPMASGTKTDVTPKILPPKSPTKNLLLFLSLFLSLFPILPSQPTLQTRNHWKTGRSSDLSNLHDWNRMRASDCVTTRVFVWAHSLMWFHLGLGRESHRYRSHPVIFP